MEKEIFITKFYLDKEKDVIVNCYRIDDDEIRYIIETPNHHNKNLITNLAKVCKVRTSASKNNMRVIKGRIGAVINDDNKEVYILRLGGIKIANIYPDGYVERKAKIPTIIKILMAQTKDYKLPVNKTIVKSYISKKAKFKTDLHTHINAILQPDILIALGIKHQIKYPLYFIKKLRLKVTDKQKEELLEFRKEIEEKYKDNDYSEKKLNRLIDDETYINFASLILDNLDNAEENIIKIRNSLVLMKDGQAVFTNLEKVYTYRYVFAKGKTSDHKIKIDIDKVDKITDLDVRNSLVKMLIDSTPGSKYENNTIFQDKLLWIAREYKKQGITYAEISNSDLAKKGDRGLQVLEEMTNILPLVEEETEVSLRFLVGISRTLMTKQQRNESVGVLKAMAKSPYVVGSDIIGEEINDITNFKYILKQIVDYTVYEDPSFTIQIHAGENDAYQDNIEKAIDCITSSVPKGKHIPQVRIGHGLYVPNLRSKKGKEIIKKLKDIDAILEFQLTSNIRLNNLIEVTNHPMKEYLKNNVLCVQGTDGCGLYGIDTIDEQIALRNLLSLTDRDFMKMRKVEDEVIEKSKIYFEKKSKNLNKLIGNKTLREYILEEELKNIEEIEDDIKEEEKILDSETIFKEKIKEFPENKIPIIIAGGSFNSEGREIILNKEYKDMLKELVSRLDSRDYFFVIGHKISGYEKAVLDVIKELSKNIEVDVIVPKVISKEQSQNILEENISKIRISPEKEQLGIYKSFNYEIFERRKSILIAFDGNSPVLNLIQESNNGKAKSKIYLNSEVDILLSKAKSLEGYVSIFDRTHSFVDKLIRDNEEII